VTEAKTASQVAYLKFRKGPEKGETFEVREELVHLGRGNESNFRLHAKDLQDYELSIVLRNDRFAIYAAREDVVNVEGNLLPAEKWVWLPQTAEITIGRKTQLEFRVESSGAGTVTETKKPVGKAATGKKVQPKGMPTPTSLRSQSGNSEKGARNRKSKSSDSKKQKANVARFITDQVGDPLVQLGEDGQLPELHLQEIDSDQRKKKHAKQESQGKSEGNPLLIGVVLGFSLLSSVLLLVMAPEGGRRSTVDKSQARIEIREFYGGENEELEDYQLLLREAALAHSEGDYQEERSIYRQVLGMLVSEDNQGLIRLTETRARDEKLRELLSVLLAQ